MTGDELAARRARRAALSSDRHFIPSGHLAGERRRQEPPPESIEDVPGDVGIILEDLGAVRGMVEEIVAEAKALGNEELSTALALLEQATIGTAIVARKVQRGRE